MCSWRIRQCAFPQLPQFFHFMDASDAMCSECLFSLSQIFVKPGLVSSRFFIPIIYIAHFQTIGMSLSLKFTNGCVKRNQLYILASRCQILLLQFFGLFVLPEPVWQLPEERTCAIFQVLPELTDVRKKCLFWRNVSLDSPFFRVTTLRQISHLFLWNEMNLSLSFLWVINSWSVGTCFLSCKYSGETNIFRICSSSKSDSREEIAMLSAKSQVDVILGVWEHIGLNKIEMSSFSVRSFGS